MKNKDRNKKLFKDTGAFFLGTISSRFIAVIMMPLYTALLSTGDYGISDEINTTVSLLSPLLTLSVSESVLRFSFEKDKNKNHILFSALIFIIASTALLMFLPVFINTERVFGGAYWKMFVLTYLGYNLQRAFSFYARGCDKVKLVALSGIIQTFSVVSINVLLLVVLKTGLDGYLWSYVFGYVISIALLFFGVRKTIRVSAMRFDGRLIKEMLHYSIPMIPANLIWWINNSSDKYVIAYLIDVGARGIYAAAYRIPSIMDSVVSVFNDAWRITAFSDEGKDFAEYFVSIYEKINSLCLLMCAGLMISCELLAKILFSNEFFKGWSCIPFLLVSFLFSTMAGMLASIFTRDKKTGQLLVSTVVGSVLNIILNFLLIGRFGIRAAAATTLFAFCISWGIRVIQVKKTAGINIDAAASLPNYLLLLIMSVVMTLELKYRYFICIPVFLILLWINFGKFIEIIKPVIGVIKSKFVNKENTL